MFNLISLLFVFLFTSSSIHSMNITMNTLSDDLIVYHIGKHLDRTTKNNFRLSCKRNAQLILSQATLNKNYAKACESNDAKKAAKWRKQGGLHYYEEIYNLFIEDKESLSRLLLKQKHNFAEHYAYSVFLYGIKQNNKKFIQWLLIQSIPIIKINYLSESIKFSKRIGNHEMVQLLESYAKPIHYWNNDYLGHYVDNFHERLY